jgi:acetyltransferase-like isoleucine patch superfamily enzyme
MGFADGFIRNVKRGETPFYAALKRFAKALLNPSPPRIPRWLKPPLRAIYEARYFVLVLWNGFWNLFWRHPLFQARCASFGKGVVIDRLPFVNGHVEIHVGNHVWLGGGLTISSARLLDNPRLVIGDHAEISWNVSIAVSREVIIEDYARVSFDCRISDSDGHPREADLRAQNQPVRLRDVRPVRISKYAWIGNGTHIMKGVTIGEGAVIGANSVVISDIPPYSLALGNPAEVLFRNFGRPSKKPADSGSPPSE